VSCLGAPVAEPRADDTPRAAGPGGSARGEPRSAYVHVPFCAHKCGYCDFASLAGADALADRYLAALERELANRLGTPRPVATIFVGGGTPTRLDAEQLGRLLGLLNRWLPLEHGGEWTVEANPGTLDAEKADALARAGVNRVSLGAQSFHVPALRVLERDHAPGDVPRAVALVRDRFERWSLDLIFGVPDTTLAHWRDDLGRALDFGPSHLSCYGLTYEKGTALWKQWDAGLVRAVEEDVERAMYEHTLDRLHRAGLFSYEISNFARPGHECRHNLAYWENAPYYGFGLGAARYVDGERAVNTRDLLGYLRRVEAGGDPTGPRERLDPEAEARETAILMLRRTRLGIDRDAFRIRTGFDLDALAGEALARHVEARLLEDDGRRLRLTRAGLLLADGIMADLL
jgi:oxygen-independent coproporphyrinogen-3 oxidase